jgi:hypothetical protein
VVFVSSWNKEKVLCTETNRAKPETISLPINDVPYFFKSGLISESFFLSDHQKMQEISGHESFHLVKKSTG